MRKFSGSGLYILDASRKLPSRGIGDSQHRSLPNELDMQTLASLRCCCSDTSVFTVKRRVHNKTLALNVNTQSKAAIPTAINRNVECKVTSLR